MPNIVQFNVNIAMESTVLLLLIIMILTLLWQKRLFITTAPLIYVAALISLITIIQIVEYVLLINNTLVESIFTPLRILYVLDYFFSYGASVAFYYYVEALAIYGYNHMGITYSPKKCIKSIMSLWGVITSIIYSVAVFIPALYHFENGMPVFNVPAYIGIHIAGKFAFVCALVFIIRHRDVIGKHECGLSFIFIILASVFIIVDELCEVSIGHVLMALFVFMLYVNIDLHKGFMLERQEKELVEAKTQIMLSQMQPHFLYNVLTTISSMCEMQNATQARDVVNSFADYLRANLDSLGKERTISFEKELEHIKTYLWLEKIRFEDSLNIVYEIETIDFYVPSLSVQPMVENAVKHGILQKDDPGTVYIKTYETNEDYVIVVKDDGVGFDVNSIQNDTSTHVGIENVCKRLDIICGGSCDIHSEIGKGTVVTLHIPKGDQR